MKLCLYLLLQKQGKKLRREGKDKWLDFTLKVTVFKLFYPILLFDIICSLTVLCVLCCKGIPTRDPHGPSSLQATGPHLMWA